jgi:hypothetical protein
LVLVLLSWSSTGFASGNDFKLNRLTSCVANGDGCMAERDDAAFETFVTNLGLIFAPSFLSPSESLGEAGFSVGFETRFSVASSDPSWRVLDDLAPTGDEPPLFSTLQLHVRKGLPFSFELDGLMSWLVDSELFYIGGGVKWTVSEGWWFLPDLAVRGHGGALTGAPDLNLANAGVDVSLSYSFGVGGVSNLTPYAGYSHMWTIASSRVIDSDPGRNEIPSGNYAPETVFEQIEPQTDRGFVGLRFIVSYFSLTAEAAFASQMQTYGLHIGADF